jgi:O-antigen ligase
MCGYFTFADFNSHYRYFAIFLAAPGLFVLVGGIRELWRHPVFQAITVYMLYLLLSGLWSEPLDWYRWGQKFTISIYLLSFIAITQFLVRWNRDLYERMLQLCVLIATVAALVSLAVFYREHPFPSTRLVGLGSLTNINEFSVVYGVFALLAMGFALRARGRPYKLLFLLAVGVFICFAWFGQSRTAFVSMIIALLALVGLMLQEKRVLYVAVLTTFAGALLLLFPDSVEQALLRGQGLRPQIWGGIWAEIKSAPIAGHGLLSELSIEAGRHIFHNAHSAYLQVFWNGGVIGLGLFLVLLVVALRSAWSWGRQQGDHTVFCMLLFAACTMVTDVGTLIERPRDQWMLFWLPLALLLAYQSMTSRPPPYLESGNVKPGRP